MKVFPHNQVEPNSFAPVLNGRTNKSAYKNDDKIGVSVQRLPQANPIAQIV